MEAAKKSFVNGSVLRALPTPLPPEKKLRTNFNVIFPYFDKLSKVKLFIFLNGNTIKKNQKNH